MKRIGSHLFVPRTARRGIWKGVRMRRRVIVGILAIFVHFSFLQLGLLDFTSIDSKDPAIHEEVQDSISRDLYKLPHNNIYHFCRPIFIPFLNYLAPEKMASLHQSPLQFYRNRSYCCSSGTVYQESAPNGSRALSSNQASFVNAPPIGPAAFTSSSINPVTAIAHKPSKFFQLFALSIG